MQPLHVRIYWVFRELIHDLIYDIDDISVDLRDWRLKDWRLVVKTTVRRLMLLSVR